MTISQFRVATLERQNSPLRMLTNHPVYGPITLALALVLSACSPLPADTRQADVPVDSARVLRHVEVLAADSMEGRRAGTEGSLRARRYLVRQFERIGLEPIGAAYEQSFPLAPDEDVVGVNLFGRIRGSSLPDLHIVITAHYDHLGIGRPVEGDSIYSGADDNASGVAALLALAEHFKTSPPAASLIFTAMDAEEMGLLGARAFVESPPVPLSSIVLNINLDMLSRSVAGELVAAGTYHYPFLLPLLEPIAERAPVRLIFGHDRPGGGDWTLLSDHAAFHLAGIPFVYFGVDYHPDYHLPSDRFENIDPGFFVNVVRTIIDAAEALDQQVQEIARSRAAAHSPPLDP
jgi:Zn-dependent M28 family amino/carboxypeptidase